MAGLDAAPAPAATPPEVGSIDFHGYVPSLPGCLFCGWIGLPDTRFSGLAIPFAALFDEGEMTGVATVGLVERPDLQGRGVGLIVFAEGRASAGWTLRRLSLWIGGAMYGACAADGIRELEPQDLIAAGTRMIAEGLPRGEVRDTLSVLLSRNYLGQDTMGSIADRVRLHLDEAIVCPPGGLLLVGWRLFAPGAIRRARVRCGPLAGDLVFAHAQPVSRQDVIDAGVAVKLGVEDDPQCGFKAYVGGCYVHGEPVYLELETDDGQVVFQPLRVSNVPGLPAIRRLLGEADVRFDELDAAFDTLLGPAVRAFNEERLAAPGRVDRLEFGVGPPAPRCSVIVPLFGRIDFLEYQMALFSERPTPDDVEFIYVLDDPPQRRELENLAHSVFARFEIPFRLLLLEHNLGFAPASNRGLLEARADHVCFLNSDAFPDTSDWIERLIADLEANPGIGVIGPRLLYEDGSIQHEGCVYRPLREFGGWMYVDHDNRGRRPGPETGLRDVPAITGACMMLRRDLALDLGGFDEAYVIGDFEDSDLCKRILARGLTCAVDRDVSMYHLERQSQTGAVERWRQNLTLYNGWVHQRRWYPRAEGVRP